MTAHHLYLIWVDVIVIGIYINLFLLLSARMDAVMCLLVSLSLLIWPLLAVSFAAGGLVLAAKTLIGFRRRRKLVVPAAYDMGPHRTSLACPMCGQIAENVRQEGGGT